MDLYGERLYDYLKGWNCSTESFTDPKLMIIGLTTLIVTLVFVLLYYYVINHPRFANLRSWLIILLLASMTNLFWGFAYTYTKLNNGLIGECLMFLIEYNEAGEEVNRTQVITDSHCWGFGIANMIVGIVFFIILSFGLKWWSRSAKYSPF